jgi:outer membrane protein assembly factor BamB
MKAHNKTLLLTLLSVLAILVTPFRAAGSGLSPITQDQPLSPEDDTQIFLPFVNLSGETPPPPPPPPPSDPPPDYDGEPGWPTVAANPERTSWSPEGIGGNLNLEWYRPIEAYIPQNVQVIAEYGMLYISTSRGLYALNAINGSTVWRFDTELPLGNSPTVKDDVVYVGGYDRRLHALDAHTGAHLWSFEGAKAGYDSNPLVIDGRVIVGNRDGAMYAIGAHGAQNQGQLIWKFQTGGPIHLSAAYKDGIVYFAANDNYAYAVRADSGTQVWKSGKLPGDGFHSFWPVIFRDKVVFSAASGYRAGLDPGTLSVAEDPEWGYGKIYDMERDSIWPTDGDGALIGPEVSGQTWAHGYPVLDASRITEYYENNPQFDQYKHKPWRRVVLVLNRSDGSEFTFDSDNDGYRETIPVTMWGTHSGNRYPPVVGGDGLLYIMNIWEKHPIPQGRIMGWNPDYPQYLSILRQQGAVDEPQSLSAGGSYVYRSISSDRVGDSSYIFSPSNDGARRYWDYANPLFEQAPGYDEMYWILNPDSPDRMFGSYGNINGLYYAGGDQNPIIPYQGRLITHRCNSIIVYGPGQALGKQPLLTVQAAQDNPVVPSRSELTQQLETEIQKIVSSERFLRPGYLNNGQFFMEFADWFENPGDTLYTLSIAYPHLSTGLQAQTRAYLQAYFQEYFNPTLFSTTGWADLDPREAMPLPLEAEEATQDINRKIQAHPRNSWSYPPQNFYAMYKYAQLFPSDALTVYEQAKTRLQVPVPAAATNDYLISKVWEHNAYMSGYIGFLKLQELAGMTVQDSALRTQVTNELNRLLDFRYSTFTKDTIWTEWDNIHRRHFNISRNFMLMVPELAEYFQQNILSQVQVAVDEYNYIAPYWFVSRYETVHNEGVLSHLFNYQSMYQAKAYILGESRAELSKYLDVPAFARGDLYYIQNLIAAIEAP